MAVMASIRRLARRYDPEVLEKMIYMPLLDDVALHDQAKVGEWFDELVKRLNVSLPSGHRYAAEISQLIDNKVISMLITKWTHGIASYEQELSCDLFATAEYRRMVELGERLDGLMGEGAYVQRGERKETVSTFKQSIRWLLEEVKRGQHIQRYKGLGEMNPAQLWETTMNQDTRHLLQVQIEDAVGSDEIFTTLMGDQVEPRREFIERNALYASNLDV